MLRKLEREQQGLKDRKREKHETNLQQEQRRNAEVRSLIVQLE